MGQLRALLSTAMLLFLFIIFLVIVAPGIPSINAYIVEQLEQETETLHEEIGRRWMQTGTQAPAQTVPVQTVPGQTVQTADDSATFIRRDEQPLIGLMCVAVMASVGAFAGVGFMIRMWLIYDRQVHKKRRDRNQKESQLRRLRQGRPVSRPAPRPAQPTYRGRRRPSPYGQRFQTRP